MNAPCKVTIAAPTLHVQIMMAAILVHVIKHSLETEYYAQVSTKQCYCITWTVKDFIKDTDVRKGASQVDKHDHCNGAHSV